MKKNGFISISLIYSFFLIFLSLMIYLVNSYAHNRHLLEAYKNDIKISFNREPSSDMAVTIFTLDKDGMNQKKVTFVPDDSYIVKEKSCNNGGNITFDEGDRTIVISSSGPTECVIIFQEKSEG